MKNASDSTTVEQAPVDGPLPLPEVAATLLFYCRDDIRAVALASGQELVVGRAFPSGLILDDPSLSRQHARIAFDGHEVHVRDLRSTNGVWQGELAVEEARLHVGDAVRLGSLTLSVEAPPSPQTPNKLQTFGAFQAQLGAELQRAREYKRPLCVVLVQRQVESKSAHDFAAQLASCLRSADAAAIYGGDALIVLLAEADEAGARAWAADVAQRLAQPLCFGIAAYPVSATSGEALVGCARESLLQTDCSTPIQCAVPSSLVAGKAIEPQPASAAMGELNRVAARLARSRLPVLILGETGVGKDILARRVHADSPVRCGPFKVFNCAALPASLMEDAFFGHEAGAFTGANRGTLGLFEQAHGGTLFLDEVGELSPAAQAALLRVLETGVVARLGSRKEIKVDVRIIAATNRDLDRMCEEGGFRMDLLHRLNAASLTVPPLRERREEIPALAALFVRGDRLPPGSPTGFTAEAMDLLCSYRWPGNVRELRNVVERAAVLALGEQIDVADLPSGLRSPSETRTAQLPQRAPQAVAAGCGSLPVGTTPRPFRDRIREYELTLIEQALNETGGHKANAAKLLNMPLRTLMTRLHK